MDTSALAKWYLPEGLADEVESYLLAQPAVLVSTLTRIEMRSLLARHRREGRITADDAHRVWASFESDIAARHLRLLPFDDAHADAAVRIIDRLPTVPLRTLDALHLAIAEAAHATECVTSDRIMAAASEALGWPTRLFAPEG